VLPKHDNHRHARRGVARHKHTRWLDAVCVGEKDDRTPSVHLHEDALDLAQMLKDSADVGFEDVSWQTASLTVFIEESVLVTTR
jgi:hypothetical protein